MDLYVGNMFYGEQNYIDAKESNWLYMGAYDYTLTLFSDSVSVHGVYGIYNNGEITMLDFDAPAPVRPTFYLKNTTKYATGRGTIGDPIRIS